MQHATCANWAHSTADDPENRSLNLGGVCDAASQPPAASAEPRSAFWANVCVTSALPALLPTSPLNSSGEGSGDASNGSASIVGDAVAAANDNIVASTPDVATRLDGEQATFPPTHKWPTQPPSQQPTMYLFHQPSVAPQIPLPKHVISRRTAHFVVPECVRELLPHEREAVLQHCGCSSPTSPPSWSPRRRYPQPQLAKEGCDNDAEQLDNSSETIFVCVESGKDKHQPERPAVSAAAAASCRI